MSIAYPTNVPPEAYLASERQAEVRHEFSDGEVREMVGGSGNHARIIHYFAFELQSQVKGQPYWIVTSDMRVSVNPIGASPAILYTYPDVVVVHGDPEFEDECKDTLTNPVLLVEVLSPSTERYDRGDKFLKYQEIPTFEEYLLIAQHRPEVEQFFKNQDGDWHSQVYQGLTDQIVLKSVPGSISLLALYDFVQL